jgi:DNA-binding transcriptional MerR regulator
MSERILTLFGEELVPEEIKGVGKSRAKKKPAKEEDKPAETKTEEPAPAANEVAEQPAAILASIAEEMQETAPALSAEPMQAIAESEQATGDVIPEIATMAGDVAADILQQVNEIETEAPAKSKKAKRAAGDDAAPAKAPSENIPEDWQGSKQYYSIGEVADLFKVKISHIRFWTNEFKLKVRTTRKGDRLYTPGQIRELRAIHHLVKERGFTLSGAKAKLKTQNKIDVETVDLKQSLLQLRNKLVVIRNQI